VFRRVLLFISLMFVLTVVGGCANSNSIETPQELPKNKVILYIIKRDGCPACEYQKRVLKVKEVKELLDNYCKVVYIDVNEQEKLPREWMHTNKTPTVHFVDSNLNRLIPSIGSVYPYEFRDAILKAKKELDKRELK